MSVLRECYLPVAGIPASVPIKVEENGYPTGPGRPESEQVVAMEQMVRAVSEFRGTFNVTDYRWFDLRDHATSSTNFQHHYGILNDDYSPKPAFDLYRDLVAELSAPRDRSGARAARRRRRASPRSRCAGSRRRRARPRPASR